MAATSTLGLALGVGFPAAQSVERYVLPGARVAIYDLAGQLTVEPAARGDVAIEVIRGGADAARLRVEHGPIAEWQTLRVVYPSSRVVYRRRGGGNTRLEVGEDGRFDDRSILPPGERHKVDIASRGPGLEAQADLRVRVPPGRTLALFLAVGAATITNVDGNLRVNVASADVTTRHTRGTLEIDSGSGDLSVRDAAGDVVLDTGSGDTRLEGVRGRSLRLDTGSGGVTVLDAEVDALRADTGSGSVDLVDVRAPRIDVDTGSGSVRLDLRPGPLRALNIDTGSGGVTLALPRAIGARFDIESGSGGVRIGVPHRITRRDSDHVRGQIGDGEGHIQIETGSGGVRIVPRSASSTYLQGGVGALVRYAFA